MKEKISIRGLIPITISALTIIVTLLLQFVVFSLNDEFDMAVFLPQLIINIFLLVSTAILWINSGTDRAKREENSAYKDNAAIYGKQIKAVTDGGQLGDLRAFCKAKTEQMRDDKITVILANVGIDRKLYDDTLKTMSTKKLKEDGYTRRQRRAVAKVQNGRVRVVPVRAIDLLSDSKTDDDCGVNYNERADKTARISLRALRAVFIALILALLAWEPAKDITDISAWVMFFLRLLTIVLTAYSSEHEGYARITETKNKVILRRIAFLHEFDEWVSVPRLSVAKK
ncbi:MAG: hypothetical protein J1G38_06275 [Clostridiales bacterium]|nr:hypothetical protein [Clostridiales bacterium]